MIHDTVDTVDMDTKKEPQATDELSICLDCVKSRYGYKKEPQATLEVEEMDFVLVFNTS